MVHVSLRQFYLLTMLIVTVAPPVVLADSLVQVIEPAQNTKLSAFDIVDPFGPVAKPNPEQLRMLALLVQTSDGTNAQEHAELLFRLANEYVQLQRFEDAMAVEHTAAAARTADAKVQKAEQTAADVAASKASAALIQAQASYQRIVNDDRLSRFSQFGQVLFNYGYALHRSGALRDARAIYYRLLKNMPDSPHVSDVYLLMADAFDAATAATALQRVRKYRDSKGYWYATLRLGTIAASEHRNKDARQFFDEVIAGTTKGGAAVVAVRFAAQRELAALVP